MYNLYHCSSQLFDNKNDKTAVNVLAVLFLFYFSFISIQYRDAVCARLADVTAQHRRTQYFTMEGVHVVGGTARESWDEHPQWGPGQNPSRGSRDKVPQKLESNVKLMYNF